jgi:hypothetical protein
LADSVIPVIPADRRNQPKRTRKKGKIESKRLAANLGQEAKLDIIRWEIPGKEQQEEGCKGKGDIANFQIGRTRVPCLGLAPDKSLPTCG